MISSLRREGVDDRRGPPASPLAKNRSYWFVASFVLMSVACCTGIPSAWSNWKMAPVAPSGRLPVAGDGTDCSPPIACTIGATWASPAARARRSAELLGTIVSPMTSSMSTSLGFHAGTPGSASVVT